VSPTQRSLKHLRDAGHTCAVTERWNPHAKIRQDLFGFVDILSLSPDGETVAIQACNISDVSKRVDKIGAADCVAAIRRCGWHILVHGWGKQPNGRYRLREVDVS
jgi:hypothetical protein